MIESKFIGILLIVAVVLASIAIYFVLCGGWQATGMPIVVAWLGAWVDVWAYTWRAKKQLILAKVKKM